MPRSAFAAAFLLVIALVTTSPPARADELLTNTGFESGVSPWSTTFGQLDSVSSPVHGGVRAVRLSHEVNQTPEVFRSVAIAPGQPYGLSAWVWVNDPDVERAFLRIRWLDSEGGTVAAVDSAWFFSGISEYQFASIAASPAPAAARTAWVSVVVKAIGPFNLYLDDFSFTGAIPVPPTAPPTPAPTPASTATPLPATRTPTPTPRPSKTASPDDEPDTFDTLTNGGFEALRADGSPYAWKEIGADLSATTSPVADGSRALAVTSRSPSTKWAYQTVRVQPKEFYDAVAYAWSGGAAETFLRVSWYATNDGSGPAIDSDDSTSVSAAGDHFERLTTGPIQAPVDARTAKARLMLRPASDAEATAYFDAVSFGPTTARPQSEALSGSESGGAGSGGGRPGSAAVADGDGFSTTALVERYPLDFANVKSAPVPGPAAVSDQGANYDWLAALGVALSVGVIAFALFLEWSNRRRTGSGDAG